MVGLDSIASAILKCALEKKTLNTAIMAATVFKRPMGMLLVTVRPRQTLPTTLLVLVARYHRPNFAPGSQSREPISAPTRDHVMRKETGE